MSQDWTDDVFAGGHVAQTDLQNMEDNFACLKSAFSGTSAPSNPVAGMPWFDTTKKVQKVRDKDNAAWLGLMHGDTSQKIWVYRNSAMAGWAVDSGVSDKVLALKGGSTYTAGAATAGSWTVSGLPGAHTHSVSHNHSISGVILQHAATGAVQSFNAVNPTDAGVEDHASHDHGGATGSFSGNTDSGGAVTQDGTWRAAAAVGTLQYLDL